VTTLGHLIFIRNKIMGKARDLARISPDSSGKIALASGVSGVLPDANAPSGSIIQVVSSTKTDLFSTTSASYVDISGLSITITPSSASSKIYLIVGVNGSGGDNSYVSAFRNGTNIFPTIGSRQSAMLDFYYGGSWTGLSRYGNVFYLDSPATTSPLTYKLMGKANGSAIFRINEAQDGGDSSGRAAMMSYITAMEIAA
jgi:hypothetical protein